MKPKNVPNAEQIAEFKKHLARWQTALNLNNWRIEFVPRPSKAMADVTISYPDHLAAVRIGDFGNDVINSDTLSMTALHEVLHVFLADLIKSGAKGQQLQGLEHSVILTLEKLLPHLPIDENGNLK